MRHARVSVVASEPRARAARRGSVGVVIVAQGIRSTPVGTLTNIESVIVGGVITYNSCWRANGAFDIGMV